MFSFGVDSRLLHQLAVSRPVVAVDRIAELGRSEAALEGAECHAIIGFWAPRVFVTESCRILS